MSENEPIIYVDRSEIRQGKLEELKTAVKGLADFVEKNEPRIIAYKAFISEDNNTVSVIHIHPDSASLEFHGKVAGPLFARFVGLVNLLEINVYGTPSNAALQHFRQRRRY